MVRKKSRRRPASPERSRRPGNQVTAPRPDPEAAPDRICAVCGKRPVCVGSSDGRSSCLICWPLVPELETVSLVPDLQAAVRAAIEQELEKRTMISLSN